MNGGSGMMSKGVGCKINKKIRLTHLYNPQRRRIILCFSRPGKNKNNGPMFLYM
jgi:hypothetical protein